MAYQFSPKVEEKFQWLLTRYPKKDAVLLPLLHLVQDEVGYLTSEAISYVGSRLELSPARVKEVASFYTMFKLNDKGKYVIQVCHNISCYLRGSDDILKKIKEVLGVEEGQVTPDGMFSVERAECLASCGTAPMMQVNVWDYHENLTTGKVERIIRDLKAGKGANPCYEKRIAEGAAG